MSDNPPKVENAPGLVFRARKVGWVAYWQARSDLAERGFRPITVPLWRGIEPSRIDQTYISDQCVRLQNEMLIWGRGGIPQITSFDGTLRSLIACYKTDPDSGYRKLRYRTRENYDSLTRRIEKDRGEMRVEDMRARTLLRWHEDWLKGGRIAMAHALVGMLRTLATFGATMLESKDCRELKVLMHDMKFEMPKSRVARLTAEQATAIRAKAHEMGYPSIALAQAIQFECMLRQKDVIGEWVPDAEPGLSDVTYAGHKWLRGVRWSEIDNMVLRHTTSKRQKDIEVNLQLAPMAVEEFAKLGQLPASGPVIVHELTGRPYLTHVFRRTWRTVARSAGVPDDVKNMDSRAGAISEATDAGADLESVRHAATHSDIGMTQKYSRGSVEKTAVVMQKRTAFRQNKPGKE